MRDKDALVSVLLAKLGGSDNVSVSQANSLGVLHGPLVPRGRVAQERILFAEQVLARVVGKGLIAERAQRIGVDGRLCTAGVRTRSVRRAALGRKQVSKQPGPRTGRVEIRIGRVEAAVGPRATFTQACERVFVVARV